MTKQFKITGMKCDHCRMSVENAIKGVKGVTAASVDLKAAQAQVEGNFSRRRGGWFRGGIGSTLFRYTGNNAGCPLVATGIYFWLGCIVQAVF